MSLMVLEEEQWIMQKKMIVSRQSSNGSVTKAADITMVSSQKSPNKEQRTVKT